MSKLLLEYLLWWKLESVKPEPHEMVKRDGLCRGLREHTLGTNSSMPDYLAAGTRLRRMLDDWGTPGAGYPFGGVNRYVDDRDTRRAHLNPGRVAFVDAAIVKLIPGMVTGRMTFKGPTAQMPKDL